MYGADNGMCFIFILSAICRLMLMEFYC